MAFHAEFVPLALEDLPSLAQSRKAEGWRYVQTLAVNTETGVDLIYSFMKNGNLVNHQIKGVTTEQTVPSITDLYLEAFVFENEIHDLFGVSFIGIAIDFGGNFYQLSIKEPMTIISPAQQEARRKAKKVAEAKLAKKQAQRTAEKDGSLSDEDLEKKLAAMDPAKAAKVRAAMEAKAKKKAQAAQASKDEELEKKLAAMDPAKAAKVRAAMEAKAKKEAAKAQKESE